MRADRGTDATWNHALIVARWVARIRSLPQHRQRDVAHVAVNALWARTWQSMGEGTLIIFDRVLAEATRQHPILGTLQVDHEGVNVRDWAPGAERDWALDALACLVADYLVTVGDLTADILTPALHRELARSTFDHDR